MEPVQTALAAAPRAAMTAAAPEPPVLRAVLRETEPEQLGFAASRFARADLARSQ